MAAVYAETECPGQEADPNGYLEKICKHLVEKKIDVSPGKPHKYKIPQIINYEKDGRSLVEVRLDCCYMGDTAVFDKVNGKLLHFRHGPK